MQRYNRITQPEFKREIGADYDRCFSRWLSRGIVKVENGMVVFPKVARERVDNYCDYWSKLRVDTSILAE